MSTSNSLFSLQNRIAFVSGAAGRLGSSITRTLCEAGAHVIINDRCASSLRSLSYELRSVGHHVSLAVFDITREDSRVQFFKQLQQDQERLDIIVNNAYSGPCSTFENAAGEDFGAAYEIAVTAPFRMVQLACPLLQAAAAANPAGASVINIASIYGMVSPDPDIYKTSRQNNPPYYGAAKAGLIQLTKYLACHLAPRGIRVNCISPGPFPTDLVAKEHPAFHRDLCNRLPLNRTGNAHELGGPVLFLASDASSYVTGINLPVDGGWTSW